VRYANRRSLLRVLRANHRRRSDSLRRTQASQRRDQVNADAADARPSRGQVKLSLAAVACFEWHSSEFGAAVWTFDEDGTARCNGNREDTSRDLHEHSNDEGVVIFREDGWQVDNAQSSLRRLVWTKHGYETITWTRTQSRCDQGIEFDAPLPVENLGFWWALLEQPDTVDTLRHFLAEESARNPALAEAISVAVSSTPKLADSYVRQEQWAIRREFEGMPTRLQTAERALGALTATLVAMILSYVDVHTKVSAVRSVSSNLHQATDCRMSWEPLFLDQVVCKSLLKTWRRRCIFLNPEGSLPRGLFEVHRLDVVLMDAEQLDTLHDETDDETPPPERFPILDPTSQMLRGLKDWFKDLRELSMSNIMNIHNLYGPAYQWGYRRTLLDNFGFVTVVCNHANPAALELLACRDLPPRSIDVKAACNENRMRVPQGVHIDESTTFSVSEALFLAEHRSMYKNGGTFYVAGGTLHGRSNSDQVRRAYRPVVAALRRRFPQF